MLSVLVPAAVLATVTAADWISGLVIAVTLPLIPLFAALVGLHTRAQTRRQWRLLAQLSAGTSSTWCRACPPSRCSGGPRPRSR